VGIPLTAISITLWEIVARRREIAHIPAPCNTNAWLHAGDFASCIAHEGSDPSFAREQQSVKNRTKEVFVDAGNLLMRALIQSRA
jgi:hypothetical protein